MEALGSFLMKIIHETKVPAGGALAVVIIVGGQPQMGIPLGIVLFLPGICLGSLLHRGFRGGFLYFLFRCFHLLFLLCQDTV